VWTHHRLHEGEELAGLHGEGRGYSGDVPNHGVDLRGLDALKALQVDGSPLGELGLGQLPFQPEPPHIRRDPGERGVQQVVVHRGALLSTATPKNGRSAVFR